MIDPIFGKQQASDQITIVAENSIINNFGPRVIEGLSQPQKVVDPVYFYDEAGSTLFYQICEQKEYYPTRTEMGIFAKHSGEIMEQIPDDCLLFELGGGGSKKVESLLQHGTVGAYVAMDVSKDHLLETAEEISSEFNQVQVGCVVGDYMIHELPQKLKAHPRRATFFPGSTLGNLTKHRRFQLLEKIRNFIGEGHLLLGVDLVKDIEIMEAAYDDRNGVTARFNLNLLERINRELEGDFDLEAFRHRAFFNKEESRVEMHLESLKDQSVCVAGQSFGFVAGETIHTECSYKFVLEDLIESCRELGYELVSYWTDEKGYFAEILLKGCSELKRA